MKVALLTDSDVFAGTERHMLDLAVALRALNVEPTLVCPSEGALAKRGRMAEVPVLGMEKQLPVDMMVIKRLAQLWSKEEYDVLHAHNGRMALHAALARATIKRGGLVATQHFLTPARAERRGLARYASQFLHGFTGRFIHRQIAISQAVADAVLARQEASPAKLRTIHNGIQDPRSLPLTPREEVRRRFNISPSTLLVVCLARLEPEKGLDILVKAMELVTDRLPAVRCLIAGRGKLEAQLRGQIAATSSPFSTHLLGFVEDSLSLLAAADLCVLPSVAEPFGLSLVEAMALGVPVVSTRAGGPPEIIQEGTSGFLVSPGRPDELATAIISTLENSTVTSTMGQAARSDFLKRFTADRMTRQTLALYEEAIA